MNLVLARTAHAIGPLLRQVWMLPMYEKFRVGRLILSGALLGMAGVGTVLWFLGQPQQEFYDAVGAGIGVLAVIGVKAAHVV